MDGGALSQVEAALGTQADIRQDHVRRQYVQLGERLPTVEGDTNTPTLLGQQLLGNRELG